MPTLSRRAFAERFALAVAAPFVLSDLPTLVISPPGAPPLPASTGRGAPPSDQEPSPLARALTEAVRLWYPDRLSGADLDVIAGQIEMRLRSLERLYRVPLTNADEPDFVFAVYRGDP